MKKQIKYVTVTRHTGLTIVSGRTYNIDEGSMIQDNDVITRIVYMKEQTFEEVLQEYFNNGFDVMIGASRYIG